jgi:uncharacterized protein
MLDYLFGSKLRAKALGWLFTHPDERFFVRQLSSLINENSTNMSRELARLYDLGILTSQTEGHQKYYQANKKSAIFNELHGLITKTAGIPGIIKKALEPFKEKVHIAFIYGSYADGRFTAFSDIDVMVIGEIDFGKIVNTFQSAQVQLGREINPTIYPEKEFLKKLSDENSFINRVVKGKKIFIIGDDDELTKLGGQ